MERVSNQAVRFSTLELMEATSRLIFWMSILFWFFVILQDDNGVVKRLVVGVGHLRGKQARSG
jgi:hypothetical protein